MYKYIRNFNKGIKIGLEIVCAFMLLLSILWFSLVVRLSYGPINADYLTSRIERLVNTENLGFDFNIGATVLKWGDNDGPIELEMQGVQVFREDKTPVLAIDKIGVQISRKRLLIGKFIPKVIKIYGPALRVVRAEHGGFSLNVSEFVKDFDENTKNAIEQGDALGSVLMMMKDNNKIPFISHLKQIIISDASVLYEDRILGVGWKSKKSNLVFTKKQGGIAIDMIATIDANQDNPAYLKTDFFYSWDTGKTNGMLYFADINLSELAGQSEKLSKLSQIDLSLKGSISVELNREFRLVYSRFVVGSNQGSFNIGDLYKEPVAISDIYIKGKTDSYTKKLTLEEITFNVGKSKAKAWGSVSDAREGKIIVLDTELYEFPVNNLSTYWPDSLEDVARSWVVKNIRDGIAHKATLNTILLAKDNDYTDIELIDIGGVIDFSGAEVNYFEPLQKVTDAKGRANYDDKSFNLDIYSARLDDVTLNKATIKITDLDKVDDKTNALIDIDIDLQGSLSTALKVIDSKPLKYPTQLGIKAEDFSGHNAMKLKLHFPLHQKLEVDEVKVEVKANVKNIVAKNVVEDFSLSADNLTVFVDNKHINIKGKGTLDNMPVDFTWRNNFSDKSREDSRFDAKITLNSESLLRFGVPSDLNIKGAVPAVVEHIVDKNKTAKLKLDANLNNASLELPFVNYKKEATIAGNVKMLLHFDAKEKLQKITDIEFTSLENKLSGELSFADKSKDIEVAKFNMVKLSDNDFSLDVKKDDNFYKIDIGGKKLDVSDMFSTHKKKSEKGEVPKEKSIPIIANIKINQLVTSKNGSMDNATIMLRTDEWQRIRNLEVDAEAGGRPLYVRYLPQIQGGYSLEFNAYNAGAALSALDITNSVQGGRLEIRGFPDIASGNRDLAGTVNISDFTLVKVPALGMLLNAASLGGVLELLNNKGISFNRMGAKFWWKDKGLPDYKDISKIIIVKDGKTSGASLGITFDGEIDVVNDIINMNGTVIPASGISKFIGQIPIIGDILTGGDGGGIIAATYKMKGSTSEPNVSVNPLSVLAPGVIRKIFFE